MKKEPEKISIIITAYNVEKYIDRCLKSVVEQTYKNLEIIIIDDGSKDKSGQICEDWKSRDNRIIVLHQSNKGPAESRNIGIRKSTGEYIAFVDSDDYIDVNMMEILYNTMKQTNSQISMCDFVRTKEHKKVELRKTEKIMEYTQEEAIKKLLEENVVTNYVWNKLYKKELFSKLEFPKGKEYEDIGIMYKLFFKCEKISYIEDELYIYTIRSTSITNNISKESLFDEIDLVNERYNYIVKNYPNFKKINDMNRIKFIYRYHISLYKYLEKSIYNETKLLEEYEFYKEQYKEVKNIITEKNILYDILFFSRRVFSIITIFFKR